MQDITIIIPNYNGKKLLKNCLATLEHQTYKSFKVVVIDNGSTDGSCELTSDSLDLEFVKLAENLGFCGAVNLGIRKTTSPYLLLLNNDTEVDAHFVEELRKGIQKSDRIFSCQAQMLDYKNREKIDSAGDLYTAFGWAVSRGKGRPASQFASETSVFSSCGGAVIYRTELLKETGVLDEKHFAYLEDVDLGYRAKILGYQNRYIPTARVYHVGSATTGTRYNEKKVFLAARNTIYVIYKNMPLLQLLINLPFILAGILIKTAFFLKMGFAKEYLTGIKEGIANCSKCQKVKFQIRNLPSYVKIQFQLWYNIIRIASGK